jgi:hypothetical protein
MAALARAAAGRDPAIGPDHVAVAREAALAAGRLLRDRFGEVQAADRKTSHDVITATDHAAAAGSSTRSTAR